MASTVAVASTAAADFHGFRGGGFHGGFRGRGFRGGFFPGFAWGLYGAPYGYYGGYPYDGCYRLRRVMTPYGWRWRRIYVCY